MASEGITLMTITCCLLSAAGIRSHIIPFVVKFTGDVGQGETSLGKTGEADGNLQCQEAVACR